MVNIRCSFNRSWNSQHNIILHFYLLVFTFPWVCVFGAAASDPVINTPSNTQLSRIHLSSQPASLSPHFCRFDSCCFLGPTNPSFPYVCSVCSGLRLYPPLVFSANQLKQSPDSALTCSAQLYSPLCSLKLKATPFNFGNKLFARETQRLGVNAVSSTSRALTDTVRRGGIRGFCQPWSSITHIILTFLFKWSNM